MQAEISIEKWGAPYHPRECFVCNRNPLFAVLYEGEGYSVYCRSCFVEQLTANPILMASAVMQLLAEFAPEYEPDDSTTDEG